MRTVPQGGRGADVAVAHRARRGGCDCSCAGLARAVRCVALAGQAARDLSWLAPRGAQRASCGAGEVRRSAERLDTGEGLAAKAAPLTAMSQGHAAFDQRNSNGTEE